ncbi:hypothetical protein BIV57_12625 [Mangrovactinospora gilvigrisea]|uniref:Urease subunit beta n=1 Tax=Mangrovactinospora gilvigrisea TaxID=1428644 RepID=A0A1J7BEV0_9ACTN|nr:urease subunit beta [Mangrovactinospora gilvigrisea]OIV37166.1 hypothetical protein BIV57_12625 [Mangrovactinospora gilvigrisea]
MNLAPRERDKLQIYAVAELARRRRARGTRLNVAEAAALISEAILEAARDGATVAACMTLGRTVVAGDEVMDGVRERLSILQVEAAFVDGTKLVTVHDPVPGPADGTDADGTDADGSDADGAPTSGHGPAGYLLEDGEIELNAGRRTLPMTVGNTGDRAVQVGSHYHFAEANSALRFDREAARGMRLDVPSGTAVRFEPGDTREVVLVEFGGERRLTGFSGRGQQDEHADGEGER